MGLKDKIGGLFKREKASPVSASLDKANSDVRELTKQLAAISESRSREEAKLRELAQKAAALPKGSAEYQLASVQFTGAKKKIEALNERFKVAAKLLVTNQSFATALESGEAMKMLREYTQDSAKVGVILDEVKQSTQDIADQVDLFADAVNEFDQAFGGADFAVENPEFDALVSEAARPAAAASPQKTEKTALDAEIDRMLGGTASEDEQTPAETDLL